MWLNDCDPKPGTHHAGVWPLLSCLCSCVVCSQHSWWWEPHIIGFVVCANYIHHQAPIIGSLSHSNWDFLSPSCHHDSRIRAGQWTFEARIVLLQVNASFMILTTCSRSEPQSQFRYLVWTNLLEFETHWICEEKSEKEFWHIKYLSSGYLTPLPQISISLLAGNMD